MYLYSDSQLLTWSVNNHKKKFIKQPSADALKIWIEWSWNEILGMNLVWMYVWMYVAGKPKIKLWIET